MLRHPAAPPRVRVGRLVVVHMACTSAVDQVQLLSLLHSASQALPAPTGLAVHAQQLSAQPARCGLHRADHPHGRFDTRSATHSPLVQAC